jgi:hypothetical protein
MKTSPTSVTVATTLARHRQPPARQSPTLPAVHEDPGDGDDLGARSGSDRRDASSVSAVGSRALPFDERFALINRPSGPPHWLLGIASSFDSFGVRVVRFT